LAGEVGPIPPVDLLHVALEARLAALSFADDLAA
jgi:hypothetical protein